MGCSSENTPLEYLNEIHLNEVLKFMFINCKPRMRIDHNLIDKRFVQYFTFHQIKSFFK
jgi:hypothetical protein